MSAPTLERTPATKPPSNSEGVKHLVRPDEHMQAIFDNKQVTALCGIQFYPTRDPAPFPACPICEAEYQRLFGGR